LVCECESADRWFHVPRLTMLYERQPSCLLRTLSLMPLPHAGGDWASQRSSPDQASSSAGRLTATCGAVGTPAESVKDSCCRSQRT